MPDAFSEKKYRGRLAPSPTGFLHLGHARTFWTAQGRAAQAGGTLVLRNDDLDPARCRHDFVKAMFDDLRWFGFRWDEGPDIGGPFAPYNQSERSSHYHAFFEQLRKRDLIYPCSCSRLDVLRAVSAPHRGDEEPVYPGTCRSLANHRAEMGRAGINWRFRVPDGKQIEFNDGTFGAQSATAGRDFGDFLVWRKDDLPSYQLAVVADDMAMRITEVVRGADLIASTFRQLLLYRALDQIAPAFYHCPLVTDAFGVRLAKRTDAASLASLRAQGWTPERLRSNW